MNPDEQHVSTEAQRQALEAMSADLVRKLNIMIQEQEQRAREFAATHHSMLPTPVSTFSAPQTPTAPQQEAPMPVYTQVAPPPLATRKSHTPTPAPDFETTHRNTPPRATQPRKQEKEESNLGMGIIIFALVGIFMLMRSCT